MKKNKILIFLILTFFISGCGFTPMYSQKNIDKKFSIETLKIDGDTYINNLISTTLKRFKKEDSAKKINLEIKTNYSKNILTKDLAGDATDYELILITTINVTSINNEVNYLLNFKEKFNMKKNNDKFEESNYERIIKKDFADSVLSKIIFNLSNN